tara:strand:+ start:56 stop:1354 length:1299 start_codon:yes stop_codon:yes gene_type:complete
MNLGFSWINPRIKIILNSLLDIFIVFLYFSFYGLFSIESTPISVFLLLIAFLFISYILGRYSITGEIKTKFIIGVIYKSLLSVVVFSIFCNLFNKIYFKDFFSYKIYLDLYLLILGNQLIINFIIKFLYLDYSYLVFFFKCKKETFNSLEKYNLPKEILRKIIPFDKKIDYEKYKKDYKLLFFSDSIDKLNGYSKFKFKKLNFWCERYLQRLIVDFLEEDDFGNFIKLRNSKLFHYFLKRLADIFFSILLLVITSPIIFIISLIIIIENKGPVFYTQYRNGLNGNKFKIVKIRTMINNAEKNSSVWSEPNDKRITYLGKYLRKFRIDELPQLINVINGDMSLIGPRPERPDIDQKLAEKIPFYQYRYKITPGLSGWAQVNYPYGASLNDSKNKLSYDLYYLKNFSIWFDMLIFFKTIRLLIFAKGAIAKINK